mgnify:CR=1 FL=1
MGIAEGSGRGSRFWAWAGAGFIEAAEMNGGNVGHKRIFAWAPDCILRTHDLYDESPRGNLSKSPLGVAIAVAEMPTPMTRPACAKITVGVRCLPNVLSIRLGDRCRRLMTGGVMQHSGVGDCSSGRRILGMPVG